MEVARSRVWLLSYHLSIRSHGIGKRLDLIGKEFPEFRVGFGQNLSYRCSNFWREVIKARLICRTDRTSQDLVYLTVQGGSSFWPKGFKRIRIDHVAQRVFEHSGV